MMIDKGYSPVPGGTFDAPGQLAAGKLAALAGGRWPTIDMIRLRSSIRYRSSRCR